MKIITFLLGIIPFLTIAQQFSPEDVSEEWNVLQTVDGIHISTSKILCEYGEGFDTHYILLKMENNTNAEVTISWQTNIYYNGICNNCNQSSENLNAITIAPNSSVEGVCDRNTDNKLKLYSHFEGYNAKQVLTGFELINVKTIVK